MTASTSRLTDLLCSKMKMNNQLQFILLSISLFSTTSSSTSKNVSFSFPSFNSPSLQSLTLLGDAYLRNGLIGLTRETGVPSSGAGSIIYTNPIVFYEPHSNATASFSTKFTFSITNLNPASSGDGLTFFLSPNNETLGSPGSFLGLVNATTGNSSTRFVAVEFDTKLDSIFSDPSDNHVGLDIDTLHSVKTADPTINLKNGDAITAWIDYKSDLQRLSVFLSYSTIKPTTPLLSVDINLAEHLDKPMYPGFSASTEGSTELHTIESWSFQTFMFLPKSNEPNDSSVINPPPISVPESNNGRHKRLGLGLGIAGPAFFCAALIVFGYMSVRKWKRLKMEKSFKAELVTGPKEFSYKELKKSTKGFHSSRILGSGAFGTVYKATLYSGSTAAVKRSKHSHEGKTEFLAELSIIACLRHKNLVPLQGWCVEKGELLLVYDYMLNGSLDKVLYQDNGERSVLSWTHRQNIVVGLASVLTYLHQECEQQVIHRDIKTSNIMLDSGFNPRLGDFGLARLMEHDKSPVSTLTAGTMGYLAPEYLQYGKANEKTDAFSYGVVILEVACGRRPIEKEQGGNSSKMVNLVDWVWGLYSEGRIIEAADKRLNGEFSVEEMKKLLLVGLSCANPDSAERPCMRKALQVLINESELPRVPRVKPSLSFSSRLPFALEDIVSEEDDEDFGSSTLSPGLTQIRVE